MLIIAIIVLGVILLALISKRTPTPANGRDARQRRRRRRDPIAPVIVPVTELPGDADMISASIQDDEGLVPGGGDFGGGGSSGDWGDADGEIGDGGGGDGGGGDGGGGDSGD